MGQSGSIQVYGLRDPEWLALVEEDPGAGIFHHPAWAELLAECYSKRPFALGLAGEGGRLRAGLPCIEMRTVAGGRRWEALPFSDHCRALGWDPQARQELAVGLAGLDREGRLPRLVVRDELAAEGFERSAEHVLHRIDLEAGAGQVRQGVHRMHLRNLGRAQAGGIEVRREAGGEGVEAFYRLHLITRRRQGMPVQPQRFFELLGRRLLGQGLGFVLLAYGEGRPLAGAVFLHWKGTLTYKYGASCAEGLKRGANPLILWEAIEWGCGQGFRALDLGRTEVGNDGLRLYKRRWGARESALVYSRTRPGRGGGGRRRAARLLGAALRGLPAWACRLAGELVYQYWA